MANVSFHKGAKDDILLTPIKDGQLLVGLDENGKAVLYIDIKRSDGQTVRAPIGLAEDDSILKLKKSSNS